MFVELVLAAGLGVVVVATAVRARNRTGRASTESLPRVVGATGVGALVAYDLGDALGGYDSLLGYALIALVVVSVIAGHAILDAHADPIA